MVLTSLGKCEACSTAIFPCNENTPPTLICRYCGEKYVIDENSRDMINMVKRISTTPLPIMAEIDTRNGTETVDLKDIAERFYQAERTLDQAQLEFKKACRQYEAARPRKPQ